MEERLRSHGLDLLQPVAVGLYNEVVPPEYRLPEPAGPGGLAVVVGNTRALWEPFRAGRRDEPNPLERYVERAVEASATGAVEVRYAHEPPPRRVAMQRLAQVAGLAWLSPANLSVHPVYGPWIALRAVLLFDRPAPPPASLAPPCPGCASGCEPALRRALEAGWDEERRSTWREWLAIRDACPLGREHRYSEEQIRYHYTLPLVSM